MIRPVFDDNMKMELAKIAAKILSADEEDESAMEAICEVLDWHHSDDGFQLGKEFEELGYDMDIAIVEELDCISNKGSDILKREIRNWVKSENVALDLSPGDKVILLTPIRGKSAGVIYDLIPDLAMYGVRIEGLNVSPTSRFLVNYENVTLVKEGTEQAQ